MPHSSARPTPASAETEPTSRGGPSRRIPSRDILAALLVAVLAFLAVQGARDGEFVLDDLTYVVRNSAVVGDDSPFSSATPPDRPELGLYRPITIATYRAQYLHGGLDAASFRVVNVALHVLATVLLFIVARRLGLDRASAWFGGALFGAHPVHAEAVGWIVGRAEVLATIFALLAVLVRASPHRPSATRTVLAGACYVGAALSKESALALPLVLLLLDRFEGANWRSIARNAVFYGMVAVGLIAIRYSILGRLSPETESHPVLAGLGLIERIELALRVMGIAIEHCVAPVHLSIYYEPRTVAGPWPLILGAVTGILTILAMGPRFGPGLRAGATIWIAGLLPVLHLVPIAWLFGDRFLYLPSAGFALAMASSSNAIPWRGIRAAARVAIVAAAFALCVGRIPVFASDLALWRDAVEKDPDSGFAHYQLAGLLEDAGRLEYVSEAEKGAVHHWNESLRVEPEHLFAARAHLELGHYAIARLNDPAEAARHYRAAIALDPDVRSEEGLEARLALAALATATGSRETTVTEAEAVATLRTLADASLSQNQREFARRLVERLAASPAFATAGLSASDLAARFAPQ